jgi:hypothetical protein
MVPPSVLSCLPTSVDEDGIKRRLEALAAQEQVDPGKAFKPTARDGAEAQLFIAVTSGRLEGLAGVDLFLRGESFEAAFRFKFVCLIAAVRLATTMMPTTRRSRRT